MHHVATTLSKSNRIGNPRIPSSIERVGIDLNVFKHSDSECQRRVDGALLTESCSALKRLCASQRYFDALNSSKMGQEAASALFIEFNEEVYPLLIDDTAHLIGRHSNELQSIYKEWTLKYGMADCTVSDCAKTGRHYSRERGDGQSGQGLYGFYEGHYDRVHNFVAHLYDLGMRVEEAESVGDFEGDQKDEDLEGLTVDKLFEAERDRIRSRREQANLKETRFDDETNKFTLQSATVNAKEGGITLLDAIFRKMREHGNGGNETVKVLHDYFERNGYESDGVEEDLAQIPDSNIFNEIEDEVVVQWMREYIRSAKCM